MTSIILYIGGSVLFAAVALGSSWLTVGDESLVEGATAFALAFVPGLATLTIAVVGFRSQPDMRMLAAFGGTGIRMLIALGCGYLLTNTWPETFARPFWNWLILFYLGLLGLEITLLASAFRSPSPLPAHGANPAGEELRNATQDPRGNA